MVKPTRPIIIDDEDKPRSEFEREEEIMTNVEFEEERDINNTK